MLYLVLEIQYMKAGYSMKCNIKEVDWNGEKKLYCITHRFLAEDKEVCLSSNKEAFKNMKVFDKEKIQKIKIIYPNLLKNPKGKIFIDDEEVGILKIDNSIFEIRDFGGVMLARLNGQDLTNETCPICGHVHSDDGKFAYMPHDTHLCMYCGNLFDVDRPSIGNELAILFDIPPIYIKKATVDVSSIITLEYSPLDGILLLNGQKCDSLNINGNTENLVEFLNRTLENEY